MPNNPCLLVQHDPSCPDQAIRETRRVLTLAGEPDAIVRPTGTPGLLKVITEGDAHAAQRSVRAACAASPELFATTSRWTVVDEFVPADIDAIRHAVAPFSSRLGATDSWRIAVESLDPDFIGVQRIKEAIVPLIRNAPEDTENPRNEIRIEILGDHAAVGFGSKDEDLNVGRPNERRFDIY